VGTLRLVELAARDPAVERIFVHPIIKERLCATIAPAVDRSKRAKKAPPPDRSWLRVVRPWFGHHDHLHVRLRCPETSKDCVSQAPLAPGDGCGELAWWLSGDAERARAQRREPPAVPVEPPQPPPLPAACQALIDATRS
jgi:penicillin-insensitive murein endopeptidase